MGIASITSTVPSLPDKIGESRNDLVVGSVVTLESPNMGDSYAWSIAYVPEDSGVTTGDLTDPTLQNPGSFTVDVDGSYLVRLQLTCPQITVTSATVAVGATLTVNGVTLTGVAGARTPGFNDFSVSGATIAAHTAEITAAINDAANGFVAITGASDASPDVVWNPLVIPLAVSWSADAPFIAGQLVTEQFVRLRALTAFGELKLVAAGERYDTISVPVDITPAGWADEQNFNLNTLLGYAKTTEASTRLLFVDPVAGDYQTIQAAINYAVSQTPTSNTPWTIAIRPGHYTESLTLHPYVNLLGWPGVEDSPIVRVDCVGGTPHYLDLTAVGSRAVYHGIVFNQPGATPNPVLSIVGVNHSCTAYLISCHVSHASGLVGHGIAVSSAHAFIENSRITGSVTPGSYCLRLWESGGIGGRATIKDVDLAGDGSILVDPQLGATSSFLWAWGCTFSALGAESLTLNGSANIYRCLWSDTATTDIAVNPTGGLVDGDLHVHVDWCKFNAALVDDTGVTGTTEFGLGSCRHGTITTAGTATVTADVEADTIFYDNTTSGIAAEDVQAALDEIYAYAALVRTLDDAYDGGVVASGSGRTIVADAGSVQIVDAAPPSDPIPPSNTHGNLDVVGKVGIGALTKSEISLDPNPFGSGPVIQMGHEIWNGSAAYGSSAFIEGYATGSPQYHNYNLTLTASPADGGGEAGSILVRGGVGLDSGKGTDPAAGNVYLLGGEAIGPLTAAANGGSIYIAPGNSVAAGSSPGSIFLGRAQDATSATLTAAGAATDPIGIDGDITIGTDMGTFTATFTAADNLATMLNRLTTPGYVTATDSGGGVIQLATTTKGPSAQVFWVSSDAGIDAALGVFSTQAQVNGSWPSQMEVVVSAANEISFGPSGATGPLVYNADTGKLTVPGLIDPTGMIFDEAGVPPITANHGAIFVSDGSGALDQNHLYYEFDAGTTIKLSGGGTGDVVGPGSSNDMAVACFDGTTGKVLQNSTAIIDSFDGSLLLTGDLSVLKSVVGVDAYLRVGRADNTSDCSILFQSSGGTQWVAGLRTTSDDYSISSDSGSVERLGVSTTGVVTINRAYALPNADGAASGDVLTTDAAGTVTWAAPGGGGGGTLQDAYDAGNTILTSGGADIDFDISASGGFKIDGDGLMQIGVSTPVAQFDLTTDTSVAITAGTTFLLNSGDDATVGVVANSAADKTVTLSATNSGAGGAKAVIDADTQVSVVTEDFDVSPGVVGVPANIRLNRFTNGANSLVQHQTAGTMEWESGVQSGTTSYSIYDPTGERFSITNSGAIRINDVSGSGFSLPATDGVANQVLQTDGVGAVTWETPVASHTESLKQDFLHSDATPVVITSLNAGDVVLGIWMKYTAGWNASARTSIGVVSPATVLVDLTDTDPTDSTNSWKFDPVYLHSGAASNLQLVLQPAGSTAGGGFLVVLIHRA